MISWALWIILTLQKNNLKGYFESKCLDFLIHIHSNDFCTVLQVSADLFIVTRTKYILKGFCLIFDLQFGNNDNNFYRLLADGEEI